MQHPLAESLLSLLQTLESKHLTSLRKADFPPAYHLQGKLDLIEELQATLTEAKEHGRPSR